MLNRCPAGKTFYLGYGKWMKPVIMISSLQRIAAPSIEIKPRTAGNQEFIDMFKLVIFTLNKTLPLPVFKHKSIIQ